MAKIWILKTNSFKTAERFNRNYYFSMGATKRLETMQLLREMCFKIGRRNKGANRKGLRRVITVI